MFRLDGDMVAKPKLEAELDILEQLERGSITSQLSLSRRISVSVGLVNALLKRSIRKGFVKVSLVPKKRYAYYLTPKGFHEKSRLVAEYIDSSLHFFRKARADYRALFETSSSSRKFVFAGGGELAEIALLAANETGSTVIGIFDPMLKCDKVLGIPVVHDWENLDPSIIFVITESVEPQTLHDKLLLKYGGKNVVAPKFLRVFPRVPERHNSAEAAQ